METHLPTFAHEVGDIGNSSIFRSVTFSGSNSPVHVQVRLLRREFARTIVQANISQFRQEWCTSRLPMDLLKGILTSLNVLTFKPPMGSSKQMSTWKMTLLVIVHLFGCVPVMGKCLIPIASSMLTVSQRSIESVVNLFSSGTNRSGGNFELQVAGSRTPISVDIPVSPFDSVIRVFGSTSNAPISARLPNTFVGKFSLHSSGSPPSIAFNSSVPDSTHNNHGRTLDVRNGNRAELVGAVHSVPSRAAGIGMIDLEAFNGASHLAL